jgi:nucleotide-binding universal stress UspA family protein
VTPQHDTPGLRRILVPLDGSSLAEQALPQAARLAVRDQAALHVVQVHVPVVHGEFPVLAAADDALRAEEQRYLDSIARRLRERHGVEASTSLLRDPVQDALSDYSATKRIDLVVLTTHGRTGLRRAWLGSVADAMVRESVVPVLMVRPSAARKGARRAPTFTRILVPLDGSRSAEAILSHAVAIGAPDRGELVLIRVVHPVTIPVQRYADDDSATWPEAEVTERLVTEANAYLEAIAGRLRRRRPSMAVTIRVYVDRRPARAILRAATHFDARLVAMTTRGRGATRLLVGSIADKVLRAGSVPLLLYRPRDS